MRWEKLSRIFSPNHFTDDLQSHASNPLPVQLNKEGLFRVYYNSRNDNNKSSVSAFDFDITTMSIVNDQRHTLAKFGDKDSYYSHGISLGSCYQEDKYTFLLFMGWQHPDNEHWRGDIGRMRIDAEGLVIEDQVYFGLDQVVDKISLSYPFIFSEDGTHKMWYGSTKSWTSENGEMIHAINYAESDDLVCWERKGVAIPFELGVAQAFSRPSVIKMNGIYHMWYSYRSGDGTPYRIGYAMSQNGLDWTRADLDSGIEVSTDGWDSEMICYPYVFQYLDDYYMMYNGNGFGKTGIGLARLVV